MVRYKNEKCWCMDLKIGCLECTCYVCGKWLKTTEGPICDKCLKSTEEDKW